MDVNFEKEMNINDVKVKGNDADDLSFVPTEAVWEHIRWCACGCCGKTPHSISAPVLKTVDGRKYLASFIVRFFERADDKKILCVPSCVILADLGTGRIVRGCEWDEAVSISKQTAVSDIACEPGDGWGMACALLDSVRREYLDTGRLDEKNYKAYLERIIKAAPEAYRSFYVRLSD